MRDGTIQREGPVGGAAGKGDVEWNEGVNVPGQKLDGRGNQLRDERRGEGERHRERHRERERPPPEENATFFDAEMQPVFHR